MLPGFHPQILVYIVPDDSTCLPIASSLLNLIT